MAFAVAKMCQKTDSGPILFGTTYSGETAFGLRVSPARGRQKSRRGARIRPTLLERSPTPEPTRSGSNPDSIFREGCSCPESRRSWPAEPWMAKRRQLRTSEGLEGRSECPATGHGHPDPRWTSAFPSQNQRSNTGRLRQHILCRTGLPPGPILPGNCLRPHAPWPCCGRRCRSRCRPPAGCGCPGPAGPVSAPSRRRGQAAGSRRRRPVPPAA